MLLIALAHWMAVKALALLVAALLADALSKDPTVKLAEAADAAVAAVARGICVRSVPEAELVAGALVEK